MLGGFVFFGLVGLLSFLLEQNQHDCVGNEKKCEDYQKRAQCFYLAARICNDCGGVGIILR